MKLQVEHIQMIEIPGNDTVSITGLEQLCLLVFDKGKGGISDKTYIVSYNEHSVFLLRSCRELILSNDLDETISVLYIPIDRKTPISDHQYYRLLNIFDRVDDSITQIEMQEDRFSDIRCYFELIRNEIAGGQPYSSRFVRQLESMLTAYVARHMHTSLQIEPLENNIFEPAEKMRSIIDNRYSQPLSLSFLSEELGLSTQHLSKIFRQKYGISYIDYLNGVRIEHAKRLLVDTSDLITDVAYEVGFNNSTHFCTTFRKLTGMSPNSFRKAQKRKYGRNHLDVQ